MNQREEREAPRRIDEGGDGSPAHLQLATLLSHVRSAPPSAQAKERIWARLGEPAPRRSPRWALAAIPVAIAGLDSFPVRVVAFE